MIYTTFSLAHKANACPASYKEYAEHVGGISKFGKDTHIPITDILDVLGIGDALWVLTYCAEGGEKLARQFSYDCAMHADVIGIYAKKYPKDSRVKDCLEVVARYIKGEATAEELAAAWNAAWAAAENAAENAAWDAARAGAAAGAAAWDAARAGAAAGDAAWNAARDAERQWQTTHLKELLEEYKC